MLLVTSGQGDIIIYNAIGDFISSATDFASAVSGSDYDFSTGSTYLVKYKSGILKDGIIYINGYFKVNHNITFEECQIQFGEQAEVHVDKGITLRFTGCEIAGCSDYTWRGIFVEDDNSKVIVEDGSAGTIIADADTALNLSNDAQFYVVNSDFNDNYTGMYFFNYNKEAKPDNDKETGLIYGCTFRKESGLKIPPSGSAPSYGLSGISLNYCEEIHIGHPSYDENTFQDLYTGIKANNGNMTVYNNVFNNMQASNFPEAGSGIYSFSDFDYNNRNVVIGSGNTNGKNIFESSTAGVFCFGEQNITINKNDFGNSPNNLTTADIIISKNDKEIEITANHHYDYQIGIKMPGMQTGSVINIHDELFETADLTNPTSFYGTAIMVQNTAPQSPAVNIYGNTMNGPRIGIFARNVNGIKIGVDANDNLDENTVNFEVGDGSALTDNYSGIWLQQCNQAIVKINEITNDDVISRNEDKLRGIAADNSADLNVCGNQLTNMGYAMRFEGNCQTTRLKNNTMTDYVEGVNFNLADFSAQGTTGVAWDNRWVQTYSLNYPNFMKVNGTFNSALGIDWFFQNTDISSNPFSPNPYNLALIFPNINTASGSINCELAMRPITDFNRDSVFGPIVGDSAVYNNNHDEAAYLAKAALFKRLTDNPDLLTIGSDADESFAEFYETMLAANIGKFDSVGIALRVNDFATAANLNDNITEANDIETNNKIINDLVINKVVLDSILNSTDTATLEEIVSQHWLVAGNSVYDAAAILFREYYSPTLALRLMPSQQQHLKLSEINNIGVYPNPAKNKVYVTGLTGNNNLIEIYNSYGQLLYRKTGVDSNAAIDVLSLVNGIYNLRIVNNEGKDYKTRFVLLK